MLSIYFCINYNHLNRRSLTIANLYLLPRGTSHKNSIINYLQGNILIFDIKEIEFKKCFWNVLGISEMAHAEKSQQNKNK